MFIVAALHLHAPRVSLTNASPLKTRIAPWSALISYRPLQQLRRRAVRSHLDIVRLLDLRTSTVAAPLSSATLRAQRVRRNHFEPSQCYLPSRAKSSGVKSTSALPLPVKRNCLGSDSYPIELEFSTYLQ